MDHEAAGNEADVLSPWRTVWGLCQGGKGYASSGVEDPGTSPAEANREGALCARHETDGSYRLGVVAGHDDAHVRQAAREEMSSSIWCEPPSRHAHGDTRVGHGDLDVGLAQADGLPDLVVAPSRAEDRERGQDGNPTAAAPRPVPIMSCPSAAPAFVGQGTWRTSWTGWTSSESHRGPRPAGSSQGPGSCRRHRAGLSFSALCSLITAPPSPQRI